MVCIVRLGLVLRLILTTDKSGGEGFDSILVFI